VTNFIHADERKSDQQKAEEQKAELRAEKAHARKLRNRIAAVRANKRRSDGYKALFSDVEAKRGTMASLRKRESLLRADNARMRKLARQLIDSRGQVQQPSFLSKTEHMGKIPVKDTTAAGSLASAASSTASKGHVQTLV
jgi:hypothetical protein